MLLPLRPPLPQLASPALLVILPVCLPAALQVLLVLAAIRAKEEQLSSQRAVLETLYSTGMRVGELCSLDEGRLDLLGGVAVLRGKGRKERLAPLGGAGGRPPLPAHLRCRRQVPHLHAATRVVRLNLVL